MSAEQQFRSVAIGGFHKQDVLNYIEMTNRDFTTQVESLRKELEEARKNGEEQAGARAEAEAQVEALTAQNGELTENLQACTALLESAKSGLGEKSAQAEGLERRIADLEARLAKAEPAAAAYEKIKDRTAGIELEAHTRAQAIEAAARDQVKKTKAELDRWMGKVQAGYDRLRTDVDATISHAAGELDRVSKSLGGVSAEFAEHDGALEGLLRACREALGPQAPKPLPLDEG